MYGRTTTEACHWNEDRMPNPEHSCEGNVDLGQDGLRQIFVDNIYGGAPDAWTMTAAISGAHTVGSASPENSGYDGHWSDATNSGIFNNNYYHSLLWRGWGPELAVGGNTGKNQWKIVDEGRNSDHKAVMLDTDLCLAYKRSQVTDC